MLSEEIILIIRMNTLMDFLASVFLSPLSELSTGLLTFAQFGHKDNTDTKVSLLVALSTG